MPIVRNFDFIRAGRFNLTAPITRVFIHIQICEVQRLIITLVFFVFVVLLDASQLLYSIFSVQVDVLMMLAIQVYQLINVNIFC